MKDAFDREICFGDVIVQGQRPGSSGASLKLRFVLEVAPDKVKTVPCDKSGTADTSARAYWSGKSHNTAVVDV